MKLFGSEAQDVYDKDGLAKFLDRLFVVED